MAQALAAVDAVTVFDEDTPRELIAAVLPDVLIKGADWAHFIAGREEVEAAGGRVLTVPLEPGYSTTNIVDEISPASAIVTHPAIRDLFQSLSRDAGFTALAGQFIRNPRARLSLSGLTNTAKAIYLVLLWQATERPFIVLVDGNQQAEKLAELIETFFDLLVHSDIPRPQMIPAMDVLPSQRFSPHTEISERRAIGLWRLAGGRVPITVTPVASALLRTESAAFYRQLTLTLRVNDELPLEDLIAHLESIGYERREPVEMTGEYSLRGGILDVFPAESSKPVRLELFGDLIESIRRFDVETQRSVLKISEAVLLPLIEYPKSPEVLREIAEQVDVLNPGDRFSRLGISGSLSPPSHRVPPVVSISNPLVVLDEPEQIASAAERFWKRLEDPSRPSPIDSDRVFHHWGELVSRIQDKAELQLRELELFGMAAAEAPQSDEAGLHINTRPSMTFHGNMQVAVAEARNLVEQGYRVAFFAQSTGELERLADIFQEYRVPFQLGVEAADTTRSYLAERLYMAGEVASTYLVKGLVRRGVILPHDHLAIFGAEDLFDTSDLVARPGTFQIPVGRLPGRLGRSQTGRFRRARHPRCRQIPRHPPDRAGRQQRRLHAARVRQRSQALRAARRAWTWCRSFAAPARAPLLRSTAWAAPPGPAPNPKLKPKCATWPTSS